MAGISVVWWVEEDCAKKIVNEFTRLGFPNVVNWDYLHMTLIYSESWEGEELPPNMDLPPDSIIGIPETILELGPKPTLAMYVPCPAASLRKAVLERAYDIKHSYPLFTPHVSISKEGDRLLDIKKEQIPVLSKMPIVFSHETIFPITESENDFVSLRYQRQSDIALAYRNRVKDTASVRK